MTTTLLQTVPVVFKLCTKTTWSYMSDSSTCVGNGSKKFDFEVFGPNVDHSVIQTGLVEYKYVCDSLYWVGDKLLLPSSNWGPPT